MRECIDIELFMAFEFNLISYYQFLLDNVISIAYVRHCSAKIISKLTAGKVGLSANGAVRERSIE